MVYRGDRKLSKEQEKMKAEALWYIAQEQQDEDEEDDETPPES